MSQSDVSSVEYTLDGAVIVAAPAGTSLPDSVLAQLREDGFTVMVRHWYDAHTMTDYAEFKRGD